MSDPGPIHRVRFRIHRLSESRTLVLILRTAYYLGILAVLLLLYGKGDFSTPPFIYQGY